MRFVTTLQVTAIFTIAMSVSKPMAIKRLLCLNLQAL